MRPKRWCLLNGLFKLLLLCMVGLFAVPTQAAFLYKSYIIRSAGGRDVLCDPYIVQKDDYVLKIFRQRGEISNVDFPEFLNIFKEINPQIQNIDKILPGQHIFIPLKKLEPDTMPDQDFGVVTIPFITGTEVDELLNNNSDVHIVQEGDTVSKLLSAQFGRYGTRAYQEGLSIFKALNPHIKDVNLILAGEKIRIPQRILQNETWYESLFDSYGNLAQLQPEDMDTLAAGDNGEEEESDSGQEMEGIDPLARAAQVLDGKVYQKGTYYFPRPGREDFQLDLMTHPVLEIKDGPRVLISPPGDEEKAFSESDLALLRNYWKDLVVAESPADDSPSSAFEAVMESLDSETDPGKRVFTDGGIQVTVNPQWMINQPKQGRSLAVTAIDGDQEKTPQPVLDYLEKFGVVVREVVFSDASNKNRGSSETVSHTQVPSLDTFSDRKAFVRNLFDILGASYEEQVRVSFPYAGIQIETVSNLLRRPGDIPVLVDFGDLQGDAVAAIEKTGFKVVQIQLDGDMASLVPTLLHAAGMTCETDPTITAAERSGPNNTTISLPGFLAREDQTPKVLLSTVPVQDELVRFFRGRNIEVVALTNGPGG